MIAAAVAVSVTLATATGSVAAPKRCGPAMLPLIQARFGFAPGVARIVRSATRDGYGLAEFVAGEGGGDAVYRREIGRWCLIDAHGGGTMNAVILVSRGVPRATAERLDRAVHGSRTAVHG